MAIGKITVDGGEVLYLALEDTERRLQGRLAIILQGAHAPARFFIATNWPTLIDGAIEHLCSWLASHPGPRLVMIDTFQRLRGPIPGNQNLYAGDYAAAGELKRVADRFGVALVVVHHTRKAAADDPLDMVSGTFGVTGAADTIYVARRKIGRADAKFYIRGVMSRKRLTHLASMLTPAPGRCSVTQASTACRRRVVKFCTFSEVRPSP